MLRLTEITSQVVVLVEGLDEEKFLPELCRARGLSNAVQFIGYGGKNQLAVNLRAITKMPGFSSVTSVGIIRDADADRPGAIASVRSAMQNAQLKVHASELTLQAGPPRTAFFIAPRAGRTGEFEDSLLEAIMAHVTMPCIEDFVTSSEQRIGQPLAKKSKAKIQSFLAVYPAEPIRDISVGAKRGVWPFDHAAFDGYAQLITLVTS